jgi:hypothetical protein
MVAFSTTVPCTRATLASSGYAGETFLTSIPTAASREILSAPRDSLWGWGAGAAAGVADEIVLGVAGGTRAGLVEAIAVDFGELRSLGFAGASPADAAAGTAPGLTEEGALGLAGAVNLDEREFELAGKIPLGFVGGITAGFGDAAAVAVAGEMVRGFGDAGAVGFAVEIMWGFAEEAPLGFGNGMLTGFADPARPDLADARTLSGWFGFPGPALEARR